jgi:hypothetical protein
VAQEAGSELTRIRHVAVVLAEDCPWEAYADLAETATACRLHHVGRDGEDLRGAWGEYADAVAAAGYRVWSGPSAATVAEDIRAGDLADLTVLEADESGVAAVLAAWRSAPPVAALLALSLGGGGQGLDVADGERCLGAPGTLFLLSPWTPGGWIDEEVTDHTSLLQLCEHWTSARGRAVEATIPSWRRALVADLLGAFTWAPVPPELADAGAEGHTRPVPYFPVAELRSDEESVRLMLANLGPTATRPLPLAVDDGVMSHHLVAPSSLDDPGWLEVPVEVRQGRYDVTVRGPQRFRRHYAGAFPSRARCGCDHFAGGDPWFPDLLLTVGHATTMPTFFWLARRLGTRFGGETSERLLGPRRTAIVREQPAARTHGWYDLTVTTSSDPTWVQEYAGHLHAGNRPSVGAPASLTG